MKEQFELCIDGRNIVGVLHFPKNHNPPCVITCHGLFSSKESDKFTAIADCFTQAGIAVIRFDFGGCGDSSGSISDTTVSGRLCELETVGEYAANHPKLGKEIGILGSSLGGFVALFYARKNPVKALSIWATPFDLREISRNIPESDLKILKKNFFSDAKTYNLSTVLKNLHTVQIIQGEHDAVVSWQHAKKIFWGVNDPKELIILPAGDHSLSKSPDRQRALQKSLQWFLKHIS